MFPLKNYGIGFPKKDNFPFYSVSCILSGSYRRDKIIGDKSIKSFYDEILGPNNMKLST